MASDQAPTPRRVLVVEDDPDVRGFLEAVLTEAGYTVTCAADGAEALRLVAARPPDAVVLDLILPELSGWEVATRLPRVTARPVPIIVASGAPASLFRLPADAVACVLRKPLDPDALLSALDGLVQRPGRAAA